MARRQALTAAYTAWVSEAYTVFCDRQDDPQEATRAGFGRAVGRAARRVDPTVKASPSSAVASWLGARATIPAEETVRCGLVAVVNALVPEPPPGIDGTALGLPAQVSFTDVVAALTLARAAGSGGGEASAKAAHDRAHTLQGALVDGDPAICSQVDPLAWELGSYLFGGGLPPYVRRSQIDDQIAAALDVDEAGMVSSEGRPGRLVILSGAPKSGKTRTLLHALAVHPTTRSRVLWRVRPTPGAARTVAARLEWVTAPTGALHASDLRPDEVVVVFDDFQAHIRAGLIDYGVVNDLLDTGALVVATMHSDVLNEMDQPWLDSTLTGLAAVPPGVLGVGSPQFKALLEETSLDVVSVLDATDLDAPEAAEVATAAHAHGYTIDQIARLPEVLAGLDVLLKRIDVAKAATIRFPERVALIDAAVDAAQLYPAGVPPDRLRDLHEWAHPRHSPTRVWQPKDFDDALDWATTPLTPDPVTATAIIRRHPTNPDTYTLYDAITSLITPDPWTPNHLSDHLGQLTPEATLLGGRTALEVGDEGTARRWFTTLSQVQDPYYAAGGLDGLGVLDHAVGELGLARQRWQEVAMSNVPFWASLAMTQLGWLEYAAGNQLLARRWYEKAIKAGDSDHTTSAMFSLGVLEREAGNLLAARRHYEQVIASMHVEFAPKAMFNLGNLEYDAGAVDIARQWYERALESGHRSQAPRAATQLAAIADMSGDRTRACELWTLVADSGHPQWAPRAMFNLGVHEYKTGTSAAARSWYEKAIDTGEAKYAAQAMANLGVLEHDLGNSGRARHWYARAIGSGHADAAARSMLYLASLEMGEGNLQLARTWFQRASAEGNREVATQAERALAQLGGPS